MTEHEDAAERQLTAAESNFNAAEDLSERVYPMLAQAGIHLLFALVEQLQSLTDAIDSAVSVLAEQATERETS
jgi:hypothetical protein